VFKIANFLCNLARAVMSLATTARDFLFPADVTDDDPHLLERPQLSAGDAVNTTPARAQLNHAAGGPL